jgi:hypothetical protein
MKKTQRKFFSFLLVALLFSNLSFLANAAEESEQLGPDQAKITADVNLRNPKVERQEGNKIRIGYDIRNNGDTQNDIRAKIQLVSEKTNKMYVLDQYVEMQSFSVKSKEIVSRVMNYTAPDFLNMFCEGYRQLFRI